MMKAIAIIAGLVGYNMVVKILAIIKMMGLKVENMSEEELLELLKDPRFKQYMR